MKKTKERNMSSINVPSSLQNDHTYKPTHKNKMGTRRNVITRDKVQKNRKIKNNVVNVNHFFL